MNQLDYSFDNTSKSVESTLTYWKQQLEDVPPILELPTDYQRPQTPNYQHSKQSLLLKPTTQALRNFSDQQGVNLDIIILAAFQIFLYRYSGTETILVAAALNNCNQKILPLSTYLADNPSLQEFINRVAKVILEADKHESLSWEKLVEALNWDEPSHYHPLYQVTFVWDNELKSQELSNITNFDLSLKLEETATGINGYFEYRPDLFKAETINRMVGHFQTMLAGIVANPEQGIAELPLLTANEKRELLVDLNNTAVDYPRNKCIHELFEEQVKRNPEAVAVVFAGQQMTYGELNTKANQLAHYLRSLGVETEVPAGIYLERSLEMIVSVIAILKAGGVYLPLDPSYPLDRLEFMLFDAQVPVLIAMSALKENLPNHTAKVICLDSEKLAIAQQSPENPINQTHPHNLAYIIYTSGSTGKPKGTMIEQRSLVNAYLAWEDAYHLSSKTTSHLQMASFSFDVFSGDLVRAICSGAKLVLTPRDFILDAPQLYGLMRQEKVDCAEFVPAVLRNLIQYLKQTNQNLDFMKLLVAGSDSWYLSEYKYIKSLCGSQTRLINSYGVSEATIDSSYFETEVVDLSVDRLIPIGRPFANNQIFILDANMQPVPIGVSGELYLGGAGLARGYLNRLDLTQEKFVKSPFTDYFPANQDTRLYKTNDKARYLADGNIEFLGRIDNQVKIRGFRIELGEIEALISQHPKIQGNIVIVREDVPGDRYLAAYVVPLTGEITANEMRNFLKAKLPTYMMPSAFVILNALPLTPNGKIDRRALPAPDWNSLIEEANFVAPETITEKALANTWCQILGLKRIGIHDNFFDLGGHSLLVSQLLAYCWQEFSVQLSVVQFFQAPTIAASALVIEQCQNQGINISKYQVISRRDNQKSAPLSFPQQRLWFLEQLEPNRSDYHISQAVHLTGKLNTAGLQMALDAIVAHHEVLRTNYINENGNPVQVISPPSSVELSLFTPAEGETEVEILTQESQRPFNFSDGLMLRATLLQIAPQEHILLLVMHHIASDGWSMGIIAEQLKELYQAFSNNQPSPLSKLPIQYADFAVWQRQYLQGGVIKSASAYWKQQLADAPALLSLPTNRPRPAVQTFQGASQSFVLSSELTAALSLLSKTEGVTFFMTMLAAFDSLLCRYTGTEDIVVGSPIANRNRLEFEELIGFFVNTLVYRTDVSGNPTFRELLRRVREVAMSAYTHQDLPFEMLVEVLQPKRDLSYSPLFQVMFVYEEDVSAHNIELPGITSRPYRVKNNTAKFDLTLYLGQTPAGLECSWVYNTDLFDASTIERMTNHFQTMLEGIVANPDQTISQLPLLPTNELLQLLFEWNDNQINYSQDKCIHQLFEEQVERTPDAVAVVFEGQQLTYQELNSRANQLANYLRTLGIRPEVLVGICIERSLEMVVGLLGILKAGGAYVPIDPAFPQERVGFMLEDAQVSVLLTNDSLMLQFPNRMVCLDSDWEKIAQENDANLENIATPQNLIYVIFTSGSTGRAKGVAIEHQQVLNYLSGIQERIFPSVGGNFALASTFAADLGNTVLFPSLCGGGCLHILSKERVSDPNALLNYCQQHPIDCLKIVPSHLAALLTSAHPETILPRQRLILGGEATSWDLIEKIQHYAPNCKIFNHYGPTESTVGVLTYGVDSQPLNYHTQIVPLGRPLPNIEIYLLDRQMQPVPIGVPGELYIGGAGLARGYLNRPDLTQEKFIPNPFKDSLNARLYKTGDLARYLPDGNIEYLGRIDNQVKIRGFRIELGEIEALLSQHPALAQTVVTAQDKRLVAYIVAHQGQKPTINQLQNFLSQKLPDYMMPSAFVMLEALPLTLNGKIDHRALPVPDAAFSESDFVAPRNSTEEALASIWSKVLGIEKVGIHDNFFNLGGHSLLIIQVLAYCWQDFSVQIPLRQFFKSPTIADLAVAIIESQNQGTDVSKYEVIPQKTNQKSAPLSFAQQRLWFLEQLEPNSSNYHIAKVVRLTGSLNIAVLHQSLNAIVVHHEVLRTNFLIEDGNPIQVIGIPREVELPLVNLQDCLPGERNTEVQQLLQQESQRPFNFSDGLMLRAKLLQIAPQEHILSLVMHHIASDGWSVGVLWNQLRELYTAGLNGKPNPLPIMPIQYADFAVWQREWLSGEELANQLNYWKQQLAGASPVLDLPTDYPRPSIQTYRNASQFLLLNQDLTAALKAVSRQQGVTLFMTLLAAFQTFLYRYTGQEDIIVGSPIAGRNRTELNDLIGFFINTLVLRTNLSGSPSFTELLAQVSQVALGAYTHQDMPFQKLVEELKLERDLSRNPLFQVWFNMLNLGDIQLELPGLTVENVLLPEAASKFDLSLYLQEQNEGIQLELDYNADLFTPERMQEMLSQYHHLLEQIVANPSSNITELSLVTPTAASILPNPQQPIPSQWVGAVHNNFSQQAERLPQQVAVIDAKNTWTYNELEERTNLLANYLLQHIQPQEIVAIYGHRSAELVWAILGVLKAGAAFVILDPAYPTSRLIDYLQISQPRAFLQITAADEFPDAILMCLDNLSCNCRLKLPQDSMVGIRSLFAYPNTNPSVAVEPDNLAYIAFTSGSTGKPKGIIGTHNPLSHFLQWHCQNFGLNESDKFSMLSGLSHDPLLRDIFTPLSLGATLCIPQQEDIETPGQLAQWMQQQQVSIAHLTPAMGQLLSANTKISTASLRYLFFGGETLTVQDVDRISNFAPHATCVNFYGATETPQAMGYYIVSKQDDRILSKETIPVGKGIADVQLLVLNPQKQLAGIGELGEIYVRTPYLSQGYIGTDELTSERFLVNPFLNEGRRKKEEGRRKDGTPTQNGRPIEVGVLKRTARIKTADSEDRLYKTGDLGRYLPNGDIEFLGRSDYQVKIRGFRVELGEIEALLSQHPSVKDNVAIAREDVPGNKCLVAYIVLNQESAFTSSELRQFLKKQLPTYMVPSNFVILEALPLTPNGKIDRKALPTPDYIRQEPKETFVAPHDELEIRLTKIWEKVLGVQPISIRDNFFELGGHSLIAVVLFAEIEKIFGKTLPLATLFQAQTIEELAAVCRNKEWSAPWSPLVLIQPKGSKPPLFFIHPIGGNILEYSDIIQCLGQERPIYGIQAVGLDGKAPLNRVEDMAEYYIKEIRSILPNGPYFLAGFSFGGLVAFEMAQQLHTQGQKVGLLALLDRTAPNVVGSRSSLTKYLRVHLTNLWQLNNQEKLGYIKSLLQWYLNKSNYKDVLIQNLPEVVENSNIINVIEANIQASNGYKAKPYPGVLTLFRCNVQPVRWADYPDLGWGSLVRDLEIHAIPGDHNNILKKPHIQVLSEKLKFCLEKADSSC
ncbi:MAG: amino acid adenylation domain-containing protein [Cyanomargarita calcarea GSE-NOS-MK-12-04C]|jgi:amino acid adenylation domain-containing protein|uniref:Amino acid adenylation domain-containing protein n=1 Tax=Cyanomargarita calcarea GSE-NOS-MK-12-04C TaxID=2839659 RepID=A0A951QRY8_9CYAN|nr:amino acid adenylation domain-containing protein [Cyanomargarita calcarea GSE-NOS-MK-12-04C]